jgi:hypothetical protein
MKIFKTVPMSTWDIGILKIAVAFMAVSIGATWPEVFAPYVKFIFSAGVVAALYAMYGWMNK